MAALVTKQFVYTIQRALVESRIPVGHWNCMDLTEKFLWKDSSAALEHYVLRVCWVVLLTDLYGRPWFLTDVLCKVQQTNWNGSSLPWENITEANQSLKCKSLQKFN